MKEHEKAFCNPAAASILFTIRGIFCLFWWKTLCKQCSWLIRFVVLFFFCVFCLLCECVLQLKQMSLFSINFLQRVARVSSSFRCQFSLTSSSDCHQLKKGLEYFLPHTMYIYSVSIFVSTRFGTLYEYFLYGLKSSLKLRFSSFELSL